MNFSIYLSRALYLRINISVNWHFEIGLFENGNWEEKVLGMQTRVRIFICISLYISV